jgi:hypothetical protein
LHLFQGNSFGGVHQMIPPLMQLRHVGWVNRAYFRSTKSLHRETTATNNVVFPVQAKGRREGNCLTTWT